MPFVKFNTTDGTEKLVNVNRITEAEYAPSNGSLKILIDDGKGGSYQIELAGKEAQDAYAVLKKAK